MDLLTVENLDLIQSFQPLLKSCTKLKKINKSAILNYLCIDLQRMPFWTSASSEGQNCNLQRTFAWCTTGTDVDKKYVDDTQLWLDVPDGSETAGNCVALGLSKSETSAQLSLAACVEPKSYLCQVLIFLFK